MKSEVLTHNEVVGFHRWSNAPDEVSFLRNTHRHIFVIRCSFGVTHQDRQIEIYMRERQIKKWLADTYGEEMQLGEMSCEMLAQAIVNNFKDAVYVEVLEDGKGGAIVRSEYQSSLRRV